MITADQARELGLALRQGRQAALALKAITRALAAENQLFDDELLSMTELFSAWKPGENYAVGTLLHYEDGLYKVVAAHKSQSDWPPDKISSLFARVQIETPGEILAWVAGEQVREGELRRYQGVVYLCRMAHTTLAGWEPANATTLWLPQ